MLAFARCFYVDDVNENGCISERRKSDALDMPMNLKTFDVIIKKESCYRYGHPKRYDNCENDNTNMNDLAVARVSVLVCLQQDDSSDVLDCGYNHR